MMSESWRELSDWDKERIEEWRRSISYDNIECELYILYKIISNFLYHLDEYDMIDNISHSEKSYIISVNQDQFIIHIIKVNTHIPFTELYNIMNIEISFSIIHRWL